MPLVRGAAEHRAAARGRRPEEGSVPRRSSGRYEEPPPPSSSQPPSSQAQLPPPAWLGSAPSGGGSHVSGAELVQASLLAEVRLVMETAGLGERLPAVLAFGIESVEDLANDELVSDTALRGGYGRMGGSCWWSFGVQGFAGCAHGG